MLFRRSASCTFGPADRLQNDPGPVPGPGGVGVGLSRGENGGRRRRASLDRRCSPSAPAEPSRRGTAELVGGRKRPQHQHAYRLPPGPGRLRQWLRQRGDAPAAATVSEAVVAEYVGHLRQAGLAPASVARALVSVRSLHRFLVQEGRAAADPSADLRPPPVPQGLPKALSEEEVMSLLSAVTGGGPAQLRDRAVLELLYATPGCASPSSPGSRCPTWASARNWCGCWAGRGQQGAASARGPLRPPGGGVMVGRRWEARAGTAPSGPGARTPTPSSTTEGGG